MGSAMSYRQWLSYARQEIADAAAILALHAATESGVCQCGRVLPCSVVERVVRRRDHLAGQLAAHAPAAPPAVGQAAVRRDPRPDR